MWWESQEKRVWLRQKTLARGGTKHGEQLCWLLGTSVRKIRRFLQTDVPSSQHTVLVRL
jgi:hypothetical protein